MVHLCEQVYLVTTVMIALRVATRALGKEEGAGMELISNATCNLFKGTKQETASSFLAFGSSNMCSCILTLATCTGGTYACIH